MSFYEGKVYDLGYKKKTQNGALDGNFSTRIVSSGARPIDLTKIDRVNTSRTYRINFRYFGRETLREVRILGATNRGNTIVGFGMLCGVKLPRCLFNQLTKLPLY